MVAVYCPRQIFKENSVLLLLFSTLYFIFIFNVDSTGQVDIEKIFTTNQLWQAVDSWRV